MKMLRKIYRNLFFDECIECRRYKFMFSGRDYPGGLFICKDCLNKNGRKN